MFKAVRIIATMRNIVCQIVEIFGNIISAVVIKESISKKILIASML